MRTNRAHYCGIGLFCITLLTSCAPRGETLTSPGPDISADANRFTAGRSVYSRACAECHQTGRNGAPVAGRPGDWQSRSMLWQAVLFEHAKAGHLNMPARGGDENLTDGAVEAAAEYMLSLTFPEQPVDRK